MVWPLTTEDTSDSTYPAPNYTETMENNDQERQNTASSQNTEEDQVSAPISTVNLNLPENESRVPAIIVTQQEVINLGNTSLLDANVDQLSNILEGGEQNNS